MRIQYIKVRKIKFQKTTLYRMLIISFVTTLSVGCKKFVEVDPPTNNLVTSTVYSNDAKATAALVGIYSQIAGSLSGYAPGGIQSFTLLAGLSADELTNYSTNSSTSEFYANSLTKTNATNLAVWRITYQYIYQANAVLEGLSMSTGVNDATKRQLQGEAKFIRAFLHFYLVNLWGDVPFITNTDYKANAIAARTSKATVYQGIIADLLDAQNLLSDTYITSERVRPNKWAATALLSRVYLYTQDWANAEASATQIINTTSMYSIISDPSKVFLKNSSESIWQLMAVVPGYNSSEGYNFVLTARPSNTALNNQLVNAFETGDLRKSNWMGSYTSGAQTYYFCNKYKIKSSSTITEYSTVFRLAEQYLIRAEGRAQLNKLIGNNSAVQDINLIRNRAGLLPTTATTQPQILTAIEQERRIELFAEWGHRWLDLKRTNRADAVLGPIKASNWHPTDILYPIPYLEILNDNNLTQNNGY